METTPITLRLDDSQLKEIDWLAGRFRTSRTEIIRDALPESTLAAIYAAELQELRDGDGDDSAGIRDAVASLMAPELKRRMVEHTAPVDPHFLKDRTPRAIVETYASFLDAIAKRPKECRLSKPPRGGFWESEGVDGYGILGRTQRFTPNGIENLHTDDERKITAFFNESMRLETGLRA